MFPFDAISNFGYAAVTTAPSPATTGTSLKVSETLAALFPDPATAGRYNVTVWPTGVQPISSNAEIIRITAKGAASGGEVELTIIREQESTSARTIIVGDQIALTETILARNQIFSAITSGFYEDKLLTGQSFTKNSASQFTTPGDKTSYYIAGRVIKFHDDSLAIVASGTVPDSPTNVYINVGQTKLLDEDDAASDSVLAAPTQQSMKAFVVSGTATLTNKRVTSRVTTIESNANPTINTDNCDVVDITAQAADIASMTTNLSGTPTNFQKLTIRIKDNGTARTIAWGASFEARGASLPTTTVISKVLTVGFIYDTTTSKWGCVAAPQEA